MINNRGVDSTYYLWVVGRRVLAVVNNDERREICRGFDRAKLFRTVFSFRTHHQHIQQRLKSKFLKHTKVCIINQLLFTFCGRLSIDIRHCRQTHYTAATTIAFPSANSQNNDV